MSELSSEAIQAAILASYERKLAGCEENGSTMLGTVSAHLMKADVDVTNRDRKPASDQQYKLMAAALINDLIGPERLRSAIEGARSMQKRLDEEREAEDDINEPFATPWVWSYPRGQWTPRRPFSFGSDEFDRVTVVLSLPYSGAPALIVALPRRPRRFR